jgi:hypothetical protein
VAESPRSHRRGSPAGSPRRGPRPGRVQLAGSALIVAIVAIAVGLVASTEVKATAGYLAPASVRYDLGANEQVSCLYRLIRQKLPEGARVYVRSTDDANIQRLAELSVGWAVPETSPARAQFEIDIVRGGCYNIGLAVRRIPGRRS